jgi:hypothetical protein
MIVATGRIYFCARVCQIPVAPFDEQPLRMKLGTSSQPVLDSDTDLVAPVLTSSVATFAPAFEWPDELKKPEHFPNTIFDAWGWLYDFSSPPGEVIYREGGIFLETTEYMIARWVFPEAIVANEDVFRIGWTPDIY